MFTYCLACELMAYFCGLMAFEEGSAVLALLMGLISISFALMPLVIVYIKLFG